MCNFKNTFNLMFFLTCITVQTCFHYHRNAQFLYSLTICMLHYNPLHVSSINMPIFRRTNFIITASGIVILCKRLYSMPVESSLLSSDILYSRLQRVTIPDAVIIQLVLLRWTCYCSKHVEDYKVTYIML
jgi:phosphatidylserine synthase